MPGNRMDKLNQQFKREIGNMIVMGELSDPRLAFVTVTYADISKDLSYAHVGFSVLTEDQAMVRGAQAGLDAARGRVRWLIGQRLSIRHIPEIKFVYDGSISESLKMERVLDSLREEREKPGGGSTEGTEAPDDKA